MAGVLAAVGIGLAVAGSTAQIISGESRRVKAKRALQNFQRQELKNITQGLRVSTLGAELQTQEAQRRFSTSVDALRSAGVRGLVGGLGQQEMQQQKLQQQISSDLDRQQMQIEQMRVQDEARIRGMIEQRESGQIAGLGSEMAQGSKMVQAGLGGLASAGIAGAQIAGMGGFDGLKKGADSAISLGSGAKFIADASKSQISDYNSSTRSAAAEAFGGQGNLLSPNLSATQAYVSASGFSPTMMTERSNYLVNQMDQYRK